jgi:hypothetical protein
MMHETTNGQDEIKADLLRNFAFPVCENSLFVIVGQLNGELVDLFGPVLID